MALKSDNVSAFYGDDILKLIIMLLLVVRTHGAYLTQVHADLKQGRPPMTAVHV